MAKDQTISSEEYARRVAWLRRYLEAMRQRKLLADALAECRARAERSTGFWGGLPSGQSPNTDRTGRSIEYIEAAQQRLAEHTKQCATLRAEVLAVIRQEPDKRLRKLLHRRYILGRTMAEISRELQISARYTNRLHKEAVIALNVDA